MTPKLQPIPNDEESIFDKNHKAPNSTKNRIPRVGSIKNNRNLNFNKDS